MNLFRYVIDIVACACVTWIITKIGGKAEFGSIAACWALARVSELEWGKG